MARTEAESLNLLEANGAATTHVAGAVFSSGDTRQNSVSHLPIPPPEWCRISSDSNDIPRVSFQAGRNLPSRFPLDDNSRCSCGEKIQTASAIEKTEGILTIYTSYTAIQAIVETSYCPLCRNTKGRVGPDLREHGVFNWNNRIGFSHELFNSYTSQFTTSETPMYAFHQTIINTYLDERSPVSICSMRTFLVAYFAFIRLQQIASPMECIQCGPNPEIVIADGISVSFPRHRVESLRPPTVSDKTKACVSIPQHSTRATAFIGPQEVRKAIQKALDDEDVSKGKAKLKSILQVQVSKLLLNCCCYWLRLVTESVTLYYLCS